MKKTYNINKNILFTHNCFIYQVCFNVTLIKSKQINREKHTGGALIHRKLDQTLAMIEFAQGQYITLKGGRVIFDACGGAAVVCIGYNNRGVNRAMVLQIKRGVIYVSTSHGSSNIAEKLASMLVLSTNNLMSHVFLTNSGSGANEAALKLAISYHKNRGDEVRVNIIFRDVSYHGTTLTLLAACGMKERAVLYSAFASSNFHSIPACHPYHDRLNGESDKSYVVRKVLELEAKFTELGPHTVNAFMIEPVVGAAQGCVSYLPGYLQGVKDVCHKYGALLIFDEVMCGMGRTGHLHT